MVRSLKFATILVLSCATWPASLTQRAEAYTGSTVFDVSGAFNYFTGFFPDNTFVHTPISFTLSANSPTASASLSGPRQQVDYSFSFTTAGGVETLEFTLHAQAAGGFFDGAEANDYGEGFSFTIPIPEGWTVITSECVAILAGQAPSSSNGSSDCSVSADHHNPGCDLATEVAYAQRLVGGTIVTANSFFVFGNVAAYDGNGNETCNNVSSMRGGSSTIHMVLKSQATMSNITLMLSPNTVAPYVPASAIIPVPSGPAQPVVVEVTLDPAPAAAQLVTFSVKPADVNAIGGHEHIANASVAELNHYAFASDTGLIIAPACLTDSTTGKCHVQLLTAGDGCGYAPDQRVDESKISNGWCEVAGQYTVEASSSGATHGSKTLTVVKAPGAVLPQQAAVPPAGPHYITAVNDTNHSRYTFGVPNMIAGVQTGVQCLAEKFWELSEGFILSFNDLSLPGGGLFDIGQDWYTPHAFHRLGRSVDINNLTKNPDTAAEQRFRDPATLVDLPMFATLRDAARWCQLTEVHEGPIHFELKSRIP